MNAAAQVVDHAPITRPAIRYHGGKFRLAAWIMQFFPAHRCYVEAFGGAASVLLQKPRAYAEIYNDLDGDVVNFFRVLRDPSQRADLIQACALTPYAREEFTAAWEPTEEPVERARRLIIRAQMGFGSAGATKGNTGFRIDTKRPHGTAQHEWIGFPANLSKVADRMAGVLVENRDAMQAHDGPETLHFVDPPYVPETRVLEGGRGGYYRHEMSIEQHDALLDGLHQLDGIVVLCGYDNALYRGRLKSWRHYSRNVAASARRGSGKRVENVWINPRGSEGISPGLFDHFKEQP